MAGFGMGGVGGTISKLSACRYGLSMPPIDAAYRCGLSILAPNAFAAATRSA